MKKINIKVGSARFPVDSDRLTWDQKLGRLREYLSLHHIANSVMKVCGYPTVSKNDNWVSLGREGVREKHKIYAGIASLTEEAIEFSVENLAYDDMRESKKKLCVAQVGAIYMPWFINQVQKRGNVDNPEAVCDQFLQWLGNRYGDESIKTLSTLVPRLQSEIDDMNKQYKDSRSEGTREDLHNAWLRDILPENLYPLIPDLRYDTPLSKTMTRVGFVDNTGRLNTYTSGYGIPMAQGGPMKMLNFSGTISLKIPADIYYTIQRERVGGPGYASLGDGGVCWIIEEED